MTRQQGRTHCQENEVRVRAPSGERTSGEGNKGLISF